MRFLKEVRALSTNFYIRLTVEILLIVYINKYILAYNTKIQSKFYSSQFGDTSLSLAYLMLNAFK